MALSRFGSWRGAKITRFNCPAGRRAACTSGVWTISMRIATYNVNGINGRLDNLLGWLAEAAPDIVCLQELKAPGGGVGALCLQCRQNVLLRQFGIRRVQRDTVPGDCSDPEKHTREILEVP
jgi:hypothetical protein